MCSMISQNILDWMLVFNDLSKYLGSVCDQFMKNTLSAFQAGPCFFCMFRTVTILEFTILCKTPNIPPRPIFLLNRTILRIFWLLFDTKLFWAIFHLKKTAKGMEWLLLWNLSIRAPNSDTIAFKRLNILKVSAFLCHW